MLKDSFHFIVRSWKDVFLCNIGREGINLRHSEILSEAHLTKSHQLQHYPISRLHGSKNNFVHQVLLDNFPLLGRALSTHFPQHCSITGVLDVRIDRILEEIEKTLRLG
jgi:hypothetical protein